MALRPRWVVFLVLYGNEDAPDKLEFYRESYPSTPDFVWTAPVDDYGDDLENDPEVDELIAPEKTFYVDVPPADLTLNGDDGTTWINVDSFQTREEAVAFAKEHYGADDVGRVALVTGIPEEDYPENRLNPTKGKEHPISSKTVSDAQAVYLAKWLVLAGVGFVAAPDKDNQGNWTFSVDRNDDDVFARTEV